MLTLRMIPFVISLSFFMEAVDSTIINTAIPSIAHSLQVFPVDLKVALISYLISLAIFIPISGWLADKYGIKRIFIFALLIFTISSFFCGLAQNLDQLVIARFFQGLGGALNLPVGRLIIIRTFGREKLISVMSQVVMVGALGMMLGPMIGGVITHHFSWHWIFWVNIPVGCIAIFIANYFLTDNTPIPVPPLDKIGFFLFGGGLAGFTFGLSALSESEMNPILPSYIILMSLVFLMLYFWHSFRKPYPIVKIDLLRTRTFRISVIGNLLSRIGFGGIPFLVPLLLQIGLGFSAQTAGFLLAPTALGVMLVKPMALPLLHFFGYKRLLIYNTLIAVVSIWLFVLINPSTPIFLIAFFTFFYGLILSLQYSIMNSLAYADIDSNNMSSATSIMGTLQQLSQSFGVAISALLLKFFNWMASTSLSLNIKIFHLTFLMIGFITALSVFIFFRLGKDDGKQLL